jgi:hypothetical protein
MSQNNNDTKNQACQDAAPTLTPRSATDRRGAASAHATPGPAPATRTDSPPPRRRRSDTFATIRKPILIWS